MKKENLFYLIFIITIIIIRLGVFLIPNVDITVSNVIIHHFWIGLVILIIGLFLKNNFKIYSIAIGFGLLADQLVFIILESTGDNEYWALPSVLGTIILAVVFYFIKGKITRCQS